MQSASSDDEEELAALNDERDRAEIRDDLNRQLLAHEATRLEARLRAANPNPEKP